jgi:DNA-binding transcriptional LysR family regulator
MTRLQVEAFLAIIRYGSITAASEKLYVTQPALSRRIRAMEEELGYELIVRNKGVRTICLKDEGKAFIAVAEKFCHLYQEAAAISNINQKPVLNLSSVGSVSTYLLPNVLHNFLGSKMYNLCFHDYHSFEAYSYVENGMVDIALISDNMFS